MLRHRRTGLPERQIADEVAIEAELTGPARRRSGPADRRRARPAGSAAPRDQQHVGAVAGGDAVVGSFFGAAGSSVKVSEADPSAPGRRRGQRTERRRRRRPPPPRPSAAPGGDEARGDVAEMIGSGHARVRPGFGGGPSPLPRRDDSTVTAAFKIRQAPAARPAGRVPASAAPPRRQTGRACRRRRSAHADARGPA